MNPRVRVRRCVVAALVCAGCGSSSSLQVASTVCQSQLIAGAQGGTVTVTSPECAALAGAKLIIPPGALAQDTAITIGLGAGTIAPAGSVGVGPVVDLGPSGTHFSYGVTVTLPYTQAMVRDPYHLFVQQKEANGATARIEHGGLDIPPSGNFLSFQVRGFTQFEAAFDTSSCSQCPPTYVCNPRTDQCVCDTGLDSCRVGDICRDLRFDAQNCGFCGHVCGPGTGCSPGSDGTGGRCVCIAPGAGACPSDSGSRCVDLLHDPMNCGSCGNVCGYLQGCEPGDGGPHCVCIGALCPNSSGGVDCVDLSTNRSHCGSCGNLCGDNYRCGDGTSDGGGQCVCDHLCSNPADGGLQCVDPIRDRANCGGCGNVCAIGQGCCFDGCGYGPYCMSLASGNYDCLYCNDYCGSGKVCLNRRCVPDPDAG